MPSVRARDDELQCGRTALSPKADEGFDRELQVFRPIAAPEKQQIPRAVRRESLNRDRFFRRLEDIDRMAYDVRPGVYPRPVQRGRDVELAVAVEQQSARLPEECAHRIEVGIRLVMQAREQERPVRDDR